MAPLVYSSGQRIPVSGIYTVTHAEHRLASEVTLLKGGKFPRCLECDKLVCFSLLREVAELNGRREKIVLNAIPPVKDAA